MIRLLLLLALLLPAAASAQPHMLPALYDVLGVAPDDTLNVRAGPGMGHEVIAELPHDATGIEVMRGDANGNWGLVNADERAGWVSFNFLARQPGEPKVRSCFGTEPFWSLATGNGQLTMEHFGEELFSAPVDPFVGTVSGPGRAVAVDLPEYGFATLVVTPGSCNDGMSDREYGLSAHVVTVLSGMGTQYWSGCCSVSAD
ncbi:hypothetical protein OG2516_11086 [Oceanicola granulosus HTCC2516]|uniref:SH3b domain-containing protein n=1 Tax=Oceanicola granulosus (strain ATCC BAA-861 / DSM 15982 / KCTC 12143 / HTCC2516) TaxID=314256 RepID=Q2CJY6_OCEGH|nr:hypothetical protein [Oceanicola granulosus]EAR53003.1 hypothetical protein OG2516_11086 [Oceanicola granulosus HTCC2516]